MEEIKEIKILNNMINVDRLFHSYLFVVSPDNDLNIVKNFIKKLQKDENDLSNLIWVGNDLDLSKNTIETARRQLIKTSFNGVKRVLVIEHAELLNKYSSNMLLKFLEEPVDNLIIILITLNEHKILDTIKSRTIILNLKNNNIGKIENEEYECFYNEIEKDIKNCYIEMQSFIKENIEDKIEFESFLNYGILFYNNLLINKNDTKLKEILSLFNHLLRISKSNVNVNFIFTKLLLELEEIKNEYN